MCSRMYRLTTLWTLTALLIASFGLAACGGGGNGTSSDTAADESAQTEAAETAEVTAADIGPVTEVSLGAIDADLAAKGEKIFQSKCTACHKPNERYVGPALSGVTENRSPVYIMNMILNPDEMIKQHPTAKKLLAEFMTPMTNQNIDEEQARALLEYLRSLDAQE